MSSELDLRGLHRDHDPDPAFVERLRLRIEAASTDGSDAADRVDDVEIAVDPDVEAVPHSRRRTALLAAAVIVLVAIASTLVWRQVGGSDDTTFAGGAAKDFVGFWVAIDLDGSAQTMEIVESGDNGFEVVAHDDSAGACSGAPSTMTGTGQGQPDGSLVIARPVFVCDDGSTPTVEDGPPIEELLANLTFVHFPATDVLDDSLGVRWRRAGSDDSTAPASSGGMWPQATVDEVREAQALADAGDPNYTWQVAAPLSSDEWWAYLRSPGAELVERFLQEELGWDHALFNPFEAGTSSDDGVIRDAVYLRCAPGETNPMYPDAPAGHQEAPGAERCAPTIDALHYETVSLELSQLDRQGPDGIWVVSRWATRASFAQTDANVAEAQATARLEEFLQARLEGEGAEGLVEIAGAVEEVPLLYATTAGARYERYDVERVSGPWWPYGEMEFRVRLFADGGGTVVEQPIAWRDVGGPRITLVLDATETTENGQPVAVPYEYGELTLFAAPPWEAITFPITALTLDDDGSRRIELVADPLPVGTGCDTGPAPTDADALAASIQADPDLQATAPEAVTIGGTDALAMDVTLASGASDCSRQGSPLVLERDEPSMSGLGLASGSRMRLYLVDVPVGSTTRLFAIAIVAPAARFEAVIAAAAPVIESIEFHTD